MQLRLITSRGVIVAFSESAGTRTECMGAAFLSVSEIPLHRDFATSRHIYDSGEADFRLTKVIAFANLDVGSYLRTTTWRHRESVKYIVTIRYVQNERMSARPVRVSYVAATAWSKYERAGRAISKLTLSVDRFRTIIENVKRDCALTIITVQAYGR